MQDRPPELVFRVPVLGSNEIEILLLNSLIHLFPIFDYHVRVYRCILASLSSSLLSLFFFQEIHRLGGLVAADLALAVFLLTHIPVV